MQVISVRNLMLRHKDVVLDVNIGKLEDALKKLIESVGPEGENLAFLAKDNVFTKPQHITIADQDGAVIHEMTIQPDLIYSSDTIYFDTAGLKRNPLPEVPDDDEIVTWKEVSDLRQELYDRTQYATETRTGVVRLATQEETDAFENDYAVVTPKKLSTLNDRVETLERKRVYIVTEALPDSLLDNTIYVVVDKEEYIYCGFNGVEGEPTFQSVYIARGSTWEQVKPEVRVPFKAGTTFLHWTINGKPLTDDFVFEDESLVAYAVFADAINVVTFIAYEGSPERQELTVAEGATWAQIKDQVTIPIRTGYGFTDWEANGEILTDDYIFNNPVVFTAVWDSATIPVIFDAQGGIPRTQTLYVAKGARWDVIKQLIISPAKTNTMFLRWTIDGLSRIPEDYRFDVETKIFAIYGPAIELTIDVNEGVPAQNPIAIPKGVSWYEIKNKVVSPFKSGYTFFHWMLNGYEVTDDTFFFQDSTIVAHYEEQLTIDFRGDGALPDLQTLKVDLYSTWQANKNKVQTPVLDGEVFIGWADRKQVFLDVYFDGYNGVPEEQVFEIRRFTQWNEVEKLATVPIKENYTFKEWRFFDELSEIDPNYSIEKDEKIRACYTYILNVDSPEEIVVDEDTAWENIIDRVPIPTLEDFHFVKWQINGEDIAPDRVILPTDRIEPYFERNELVVTIDPNGGESPQTEVVVGEGLTWADEKVKFEDASKKYYTFIGWSLDGQTLIPEDYAFQESVTVIALYERIQIDLTFNAKSSVPLTQNITVGAGSTWKEIKEQVQDPEQHGLYFMYWIGELGQVTDTYLFEYSQTMNAYFKLAIQLDFDGDEGIPDWQEVITYQGSNFKNVKRYLIEPSVAAKNFIGWGEKRINCAYPKFTSSIGLPAEQVIEVLKNRTFGEIKDQVKTPVEKYYTFYNWITPDNAVLMDDYVHLKTEEFRANITRNQTVITVDTGTTKYEITVDEGSTWGQIKHLIPNPTLEDYRFDHWALGNKILVDGDIIEGSAVEINACFTLTEPSIIIKHPDGTTSEFDFTFGQTWQDIMDSVPVPDKPDFDFDHWEMNDAPIEPGYVLQPGDIIEPVYTRKQIQITLDLDGGTSSQATVTVGQGLTWAEEKAKFVAPTKEYHTFKYWTCNGYEVQDSYRFTGPATFVAVYERNKFELTVISDGVIINTLEIDEGLTFAEIKTRLAIPKKIDYKFTHWSLTENGVAIGDSDVFAQDTIIYAVFVYNVCNLVFDVQFGEPEIQTFKVFKGTTFAEAKKRIPEIERDGYEFVGWSLAPDGEILPDESVFMDDIINLYAIWNNLTYITFDVDNAGVQTQIVATTIGTKLSDILDQVLAPEKEDYAFIGWAQVQNGVPIDDMVFTDDTRLYAVFSLDVCIITFETYDGNGIDDMKVKKGTKFSDIKNDIDVPISELDGPFRHWAITPNGNAVTDDYIFDIPTVRLYAVYWGSVAITFDVTEGTPAIDPVVVPYATTLENVQKLITMPTRQGHMFAGWEVVRDTDLTVLMFDTDSDSEQQPISVQDGTTWAELKEQIPNPTKANHEFSHWSMTRDGLPIDDTYVFDGDLISIYANYNINLVEISFDVADGTPAQTPIIVDYATHWRDVKDSVATPSRSNYQFKHWSLKENGEPIGDDQALTTPKVTIYAVWKIINITIDFETFDGVPAQSQLTVPSDSTWVTIKPQVSSPAKPGYKFSHWSLHQNGLAIPDTHTFPDSTTVYAIYGVTRLVITLNGSEQAEFDTLYGTKWEVLKHQILQPEQDGKVFRHWSLAEDSDAITDEHEFTADTEIFAVFDTE